MRHSVRRRITFGMIFLFLIILVLSVFSGYYLNKLSGKTSAILKENYLSVVYARDMSESIMNIDREITTSFFKKITPDTVRILDALNHFGKSLFDEKNNITEPGEDRLVADIETAYMVYKDSLLHIMKSPGSSASMVFLQNNSAVLDQELLQLSQMNGRAIELKTDDAKVSAKSALTKMTILASICFLIGMSYTFSFGAYFNRRIYQLHNGIKQIAESNFDQHMFFEGQPDEFYEISVVFNEMVDKLKENERKLSLTLPSRSEKNLTNKDLEELKEMILRIKTMEIETVALLSKFEKK
jgi:nitrogen fixation/metabolism regulation signal transduction histidine kinase